MKKILLLLLSLVLLCGCNEKEAPVYSGATYSIEVPITATTAYVFNLPVELAITETDNNTYWLFSDGTRLYCLSEVAYNYMSYDSVLDVYTTSDSICKKFKDCGILLKNTDVNLKHYLVDGKYEDRGNYVLNPDNRDLKPDYKQVEMFMTDSNLYMPEEAEEHLVNEFKVSMISDSKDWLESWVQDGKIEEIETKLITLALNNSSSDDIDSWYKDDEIVIYVSGDNIAAAKKLRYNEWYIYYGTYKYDDYIYQGLDKVHAD